MKEKVSFELSQRKHEKEVPVLRVMGHEQEEYTVEDLYNDTVMGDICDQMITVLLDKNRIFNIKLVMIPESDTKQTKAN